MTHRHAATGSAIRGTVPVLTTRTSQVFKKTRMASRYSRFALKVGVTTVGDVRAAGGDVRRDPARDNPNHCELCGLPPAQGEKLFNPVITNPG
jgi:hypothetical protein